MIKLINISKKYEDKEVLKNINIEFPESGFIAIKGKSGCGKTTLFNIIGLLDDYSGKLFIDDILINKHKCEKIRREKISYVFQDGLLLEYLTVYENIILPLKNLKLNIDESKIDKYLNLYQISSLKNKKVSYLSGGERTRVAIIRAIITNPKYILADEPIGNVDKDNARNIMDEFKSLSKDRSIIMVTHNNDFDDYYDKIYEIKDMNIYEIK